MLDEFPPRRLRNEEDYTTFRYRAGDGDGAGH
jgi:hypothetical protein